MWSRRDLLRAAGAGAAAAIVGGIGCGAGAPAVATVEPGRAREAAIGGLRDALAILAARLREPVVYAIARRRVRAVVDLAGREVRDETALAVIVAGRDPQGRWRERAIDRAAPDAVRAAARALVEDLPAGASATIAGGAPIEADAALDVDPDGLTSADWLAQASDVAARAAARATSRIVYRAAYVACDDERVRVLSAAGERVERRVRTRIGATAVSWQGALPIAGSAEVVGGGGPDARRLGDEAIARAIADALTIYTPGPIAARPAVDVVLAPAVIAAIVDAGWAAAPAGGPLAIVDDPRLPSGFGSYAFDDLGIVPAAAAVGGGAAWPAAGRTRRDPARWILGAAPSNLVVAAGTTPAAALEAALADGLVIDGLADVRANARGELTLRAQRARQLEQGARTGRVWRDVELRGDAAALLGGIAAIGDRAETIAPVDDDRPPRSIVVPWVTTRAAIAPARGGA